ncbi:MAG TPA: diguanylate cyclase response regulator, partial [Pseudomonas sp.]|nr:diguanylate cyclase response regulator [Pseudomonas sp.]
FLKQRLHKTDHIGRYGGEEFAVVMPDTTVHNAAKVLDEIRERFSEIRYPAQPADLSCTFSCGIAELTPDADTKLLTQQADEALYTAKHAGRNRVEWFLPS